MTVSDELDSRLRFHIRTRGDLSGLVSDAITAHLNRLDERASQATSTQIEPVDFSRSQRFGVGLNARINARNDGIVLEVSVDQLFRERYIERQLARSYREKADLDWPPLEHASRQDINKLRTVPLEEQAERAFYSYVEMRLEAIRAWVHRQANYHQCEDLPLKISFDEESGLWICTYCGHVSEGGKCWTCGRLRATDQPVLQEKE